MADVASRKVRLVFVHDDEGTAVSRAHALYEEAIRRLVLENDALRSGGTVLPLPNRSTPAPPGPS
ncbi:hypothetical protein [Streptomyces canus]|uniref:hypothetical protein n=1 Tax=Streptomyces canus TaxID=58343 RepID=UPI002E2A9C18|nr:hypothetical protein [Streptomyces canus]